jgi:hypothetical protein
MEVSLETLSEQANLIQHTWRPVGHPQEW